MLLPQTTLSLNWYTDSYFHSFEFGTRSKCLSIIYFKVILYWKRKIRIRVCLVQWRGGNRGEGRGVEICLVQKRGGIINGKFMCLVTSPPNPPIMKGEQNEV